MLSLLLLASPAHADRAYTAPCSAGWLAPVDGQTDVPIDGRFLASACGGASLVSVELLRPEAAPMALETVAEANEVQSVWTGAPLEPDTQYELVARDGDVEIARLRFTTGDQPAAPVDEAPEFDVVYTEVIHDGVWGRRSGDATTLVELKVSPGGVDPANLGLVVVEGPGPADVTAVAGPFEHEEAWVMVGSVGPSRAAGEKVCVTVTVQDAAGTPSPPSTQCFLPDEESWRPTPFRGGCAVDAGGGAALGWGVALVAVLRRRRGRTSSAAGRTLTPALSQGERG